MLFPSPELQAYRDNRARRLNASRTPRMFGTGGSWRPLGPKELRGMDAFMDWVDANSDRMPKHNPGCSDSGLLSFVNRPGCVAHRVVRFALVVEDITSAVFPAVGDKACFAINVDQREMAGPRLSIPGTTGTEANANVQNLAGGVVFLSHCRRNRHQGFDGDKRRCNQTSTSKSTETSTADSLMSSFNRTVSADNSIPAAMSCCIPQMGCSH